MEGSSLVVGARFGAGLAASPLVYPVQVAHKASAYGSQARRLVSALLLLQIPFNPQRLLGFQGLNCQGQPWVSSPTLLLRVENNKLQPARKA